MPNLRKMLGNVQSEECRSLMRLMETQSKKTLADWAVAYAKAIICRFLKRSARRNGAWRKRWLLVNHMGRDKRR